MTQTIQQNILDFEYKFRKFLLENYAYVSTLREWMRTAVDLPFDRLLSLNDIHKDFLRDLIYAHGLLHEVLSRSKLPGNSRADGHRIVHYMRDVCKKCKKMLDSIDESRCDAFIEKNDLTTLKDDTMDYIYAIEDRINRLVERLQTV